MAQLTTDHDPDTIIESTLRPATTCPSNETYICPMNGTDTCPVNGDPKCPAC